MRRRRSPGGSLRGGLDGVADVLAVAESGQSDLAAGGIEHGVAIAGIGPRLLAADIKLGAAVGRIVHVFGWRDAGRSVEAQGTGRAGLGLRLVGDPVLGQAFAAALAAKAAFPVSAETRGGVEHVGRIDPDDASLDASGDLKRAIDVLRPDGRREAVAGVVGEGDRFIRRAKGRGDQHRAEDFFAREHGGRVDAGDQGRRVEAASIGQGIVGAKEFEPLLLALAHEPTDPLELNGRDDRADVGRLVERIANCRVRHAGAQLGVESVGGAFRDQEPRACAAHLPLIEPDRVDHALDGAVQIRILEHDERGLAAEFERQLLACAGRRFANRPADLGRTREGDLVHARMRDQRGACRPVAGDDIDDTGGQPRLDADGGEGERG